MRRSHPAPSRLTTKREQGKGSPTEVHRNGSSLEQRSQSELKSSCSQTRVDATGFSKVEKLIPSQIISSPSPSSTPLDSVSPVRLIPADKVSNLQLTGTPPPQRSFSHWDTDPVLPPSHTYNSVKITYVAEEAVVAGSEQAKCTNSLLGNAPKLK